MRRNHLTNVVVDDDDDEDYIHQSWSASYRGRQRQQDLPGPGNSPHTLADLVTNSAVDLKCSETTGQGRTP
jgi:hypothetical protein